MTLSNVSGGVLRELAIVRKNESALANWSQSMSLLLQSGMLDVLKELGKPQQVLPTTPNFVAAQAAEANRAFGVNQAVELLTRLRELLVSIPAEAPALAEFGGLDRAILSQDLTEEEAYAIRNNTTIPRLRRNTEPI